MHNLRGADIRQWRKDNGLNQEEAAQALGIAREWLSRIENERSPVSAEIYLRLIELKRKCEDKLPNSKARISPQMHFRFFRA